MPIFAANPARPYAVLVGTAATLKTLSESAVALQAVPGSQVLMLLEISAADALKLRPSTVIIDGMPAHVIACVAELAAMNIASRIVSEAELPGCFEGSVQDLLGQWLNAQSAPTKERMTLYVAGPTPLCAAVHDVAARHHVECRQQVSER